MNCSFYYLGANLFKTGLPQPSNEHVTVEARSFKNIDISQVALDIQESEILRKPATELEDLAHQYDSC